MKPANQAIKYAPCGRRTLVPRAVYGERYEYGNTMKRILALIFAFAISPMTVACDCEETPFISVTTVEGDRIGLFANEEYFRNGEIWDINYGEPPLSISEAVTIVRGWAKDFYPSFDSVIVNDFRMHEYGCWNTRGHWLYVFSLSPIKEGKQLHSGGYMAAVTMSGTVIEPKNISE